MRCPFCYRIKNMVIDSRTAAEGAAVRRRRECLACKRRFTTYERAEGILSLGTERLPVKTGAVLGDLATGAGR